MAVKNIEKFFLNTLLQISIGGVALVLSSDAILFPEDTLSIAIDIAILAACVSAYVIRRKYPSASVLIVAWVVLAAMFYQCTVVPVNTTTSLSIILIVGFIISVMLKGRLMWIMHVLAFLIIHLIFLIQYRNPGHRFSESINDLVTVAITYSILYFILTFATGILKRAYDKIYQSLRASHMELHQKASEMASQNEVLVQTQENLNALNSDLELIISERTAKIQAQNEILLKYSYTNAHDLRGPVARLLGLASVYRLEGNQNGEFIIAKMEDQAKEIDAVVKKINTDLESSSNGIEKIIPVKDL
jgi:signal transduction histidine kinase